MAPIGSFSGIVHLVVKYPYLLVVVFVVSLAMNMPTAFLKSPAPPVPVLSAPRIAYTPLPAEPCRIEVARSGSKPRQIGSCYFRHNAFLYPSLGAEMDNVCEYGLDDTILYLRSRRDSIVLDGSRANNVRAYLIRNGIDAQRIKVVKRGVKLDQIVDLTVLEANS